MNKHAKCLCWCLDPRFWCRASLHMKKNRGCSSVSHYIESCTDLAGSAAGGISLSSSSSGPCDGISLKQLWTSLLLPSSQEGPLFPRVCLQMQPLVAGTRTYTPEHHGLDIIWELVFTYKITNKRKTSYFRVLIKVDMTWGSLTNVLNY